MFRLLANFKAFWQKFTSVQRLSFVSLLIFLFSLPIAVWLVGQQTGWFGRASTALPPDGKLFGLGSQSRTPKFAPDQLIIKLKPGHSLGTGRVDKSVSIQTEGVDVQTASTLQNQLLGIGTINIEKTVSSAKSPEEVASTFAQKFPERAGRVGIQAKINQIPDLTRFYTITFDPQRFGIQPLLEEFSYPENFDKYQFILDQLRSNPAVEDVQLNYLYETTQTDSINGSIEGSTTGTVDQNLKYTAKGLSNRNVKSVAIYWARANADLTQGSSWTQIAKTEDCTGFFASGLGECPAEGVFTPKEAGEYYISVVVIGDVGPCSGNPRYDAVAGWLDCGQNDLIKLTVSQFVGESLPTPTPTSEPTPSANPTPLPSSTPAPGYPNDPYFWSSNSWGQGYDDLWDMKKIKADQAWPLVATSSATVVVAVSDTGVDYNHEDLRDVMWTDSNGKHGYDFVNNDDDPMDDHYHGTHVAGTIGAAVNNGKGMAGVASNVKIMAVKGLDSGGSGWSSDLADGIVWATDHGAQVINMSWGGGGDSPVLRDALDYAYIFGVLPVAAAGNSNSDAKNFRPAMFPVVMAVSASDPNDERTYFSNWGSKIDLAAPGGGTRPECNTELCSNILSTEASLSNLPPELKITTNGVGYARLAGTSMAAPHVAGAAAMVLSVNPTLLPQQVRAVLLNSADDVGIEGKDSDSGYGRLNVFKAVTEMDTETPRLPQIEIIQPISGQGVRDIITIKGSVNQPGGEANFSIAYSTSLDGLWQINGITLTNNGMGNITSDVLGTWDTKVVSDGRYYLRVQAGTDKKNTAAVVVIVRNSLPDGWPVKLFQRGYGGPVITTGDLDDNATDETIIQFGNETHALNTNGQEIEGWPVLLGDHNEYTGAQPSIGAVSLDNPGKEVVLESWGSYTGDSTVLRRGLYVLDKNGHPLPGWPKTEAGGYSLSLSYRPINLEDLDGDGVNEIIYATYGSDAFGNYKDLLVAFHGDGTLLPGFPIVVSGEYIQNVPYIIKVDSDVRIVFFVGTYGHTKLVQYDASGNLVFSSDYFSSIYPADDFAVDITGDGTPEIIWTHRPSTPPNESIKTEFYAVDLQGNNINGWPKTIDTGIVLKVDDNWNIFDDHGRLETLPADFDGDGKTDIVQLGIHYYRNNLTDFFQEIPVAFGVKGDGSTFEFPMSVPTRMIAGFQHHAIMDTDGDGKQEIVYVGHDDATKRYYLTSIQLDGNSSKEVLDEDIAQRCSYHDSFGYEYFHTAKSPVSLAQLHDTGRPSLIVPVCGNVSSDYYERRLDFYTFRMEGPSAQHAWPQYLHDSRHTNLYSLVPEQGATTFQSVQLNVGWNMVGLAVDKGQNYRAEDFARDLNSSLGGEKIVNVIGWQNGRYIVYSVGSDANNFPIALGQGYFVRSTEDGTATISGATPTLTSINISSAWSLVSFPRQMEGIQNAEDLLQALKTQGIDARTIIRWVGGRYEIHQIDSDANNFLITPGEGYFIRNYGNAGTFTLP